MLLSTRAVRPFKASCITIDTHQHCGLWVDRDGLRVDSDGLRVDSGGLRVDSGGLRGYGGRLTMMMIPMEEHLTRTLSSQVNKEHRKIHGT